MGALLTQIDFVLFSSFFLNVFSYDTFKCNYSHMENEYNGNNKEENKFDHYWVKLYIANDSVNSIEGEKNLAT